MIQIQNKQEKLIIVVHEIYGMNQFMESVCKRLSEQGDFDMICPNLLGSPQPYDYFEEEAAYRHFMENVGFTHASQKIKDILSDVKNEYQQIFIVGFSVGATVAWLCSEEDGLTGIVGYYGSRIRDFKEITPQSPVILFFPQVENSFDVDALISYLDGKNVEIHKFKGKHGFSDPFSPNYDAVLAETAFAKLLNFLEKEKN
ncbi:dienelactone hydrolase family protein [Neobacillus kokaensis]|uniref:Hydrolase n=1 Tax=Neobacillus kokaensis TaxID=2759023 RepID=A0ABQ3NCE3_9BACI|nr:dienelactone hydrolase family protein [Neobacillus kokaensis]GHI01581.1 hydrolase [Neobacillus kokaensis]